MAETARIVTIAGGAIPSTGLRSLERAIGEPTSIAPDNAGGAYFVSKTHGLVYHAAQNGALRVIAGQGGQTFSGDGGPATSAQLKGPSGIAVDRTGNLTG
jgi:DNA-binding beta-propeller fold protein YncE